MGKLTDKIAIITGATSGIGWATAKLFAAEGAKLVLAGRRQEKGDILVEEIEAAGGTALFIRTDVTLKSDIDALVKGAIDSYGRIDILVNNAGVLTTFDFVDMNEEIDYDRVFDTNVRAYFLLTQKVLPYMLKQSYGAIVNVASIASEVGVPNNVSYAASKGAVKQFTKSLAGELATTGIRVNMVMPGLTNSDMVPPGSAFENEAIKIVPMRRAAAPTEIAPGLLFFASEDSSFCTGASLVIDGGATSL